jgi:hypothetical protein
MLSNISILLDITAVPLTSEMYALDSEACVCRRVCECRNQLDRKLYTYVCVLSAILDQCDEHVFLFLGMLCISVIIAHASAISAVGVSMLLLGV